MKKLFIFALLVLPMTTFAASSVRVLGSGSNLPGSGTTKTTSTSAKVAATPKATLPKAATTAAKAGDGSSSRIGTVRVKPTTKTATTTATPGTTSNAAAAAGSRFPVITPAHSYDTVVNPQAGNGVKPSGQEVDLSNYYNKQEVDDLIDDPRFDMIRISEGNPRTKWIGNPLLQQREDEHYVFMWIEE